MEKGPPAANVSVRRVRVRERQIRIRCPDIILNPIEKMPEMTYRVTKINQYGKRQNRNLKLTKIGIENVRPSGKVSSTYAYEEVVNVSMKNVSTFYIQYREAKHFYVYKSEVAIHIVQEINSRLLELKKSRVRVERTSVAMNHQKKLQKEGTLMLALEDLLMPSLEDGAILCGDSVCPSQSAGDDGGMTRRKLRAKKLERLTGQSQEQRLAHVIDEMLLGTGPVGKTVRSFLSNVSVLQKNPATLLTNVRQFMDSLRSYILESHESELVKLLVVEVDHHQEDSNHSALATLSSAVESSVERGVILPIKERLYATLNERLDAEESSNLQSAIDIAKTKPQRFFGISDELCSPSKWFGPIQELRSINECVLPSEQLSAIMKAAKTVYGLVNYERNKGKPQDEIEVRFLSADDFFPIFIYVACHARLNNPLVLMEYLMGLCDPLLLNGEAGYYLTVLSSAYQYLKKMTFSESPMGSELPDGEVMSENETSRSSGEEGTSLDIPKWTMDLRSSVELIDHRMVDVKGSFLFDDYDESDLGGLDYNTSESDEEFDDKDVDGPSTHKEPSNVPRDSAGNGGADTRHDEDDPLDVVSPLSQSEPAATTKRLDALPHEKRSLTDSGAQDPRNVDACRVHWRASRVLKKRTSQLEIGSSSFIISSSSSSRIKSEAVASLAEESDCSKEPLVFSMEHASNDGDDEVRDNPVGGDEHNGGGGGGGGGGGTEGATTTTIINFGQVSLHARGETEKYGSFEGEA